jgi:glycosyltransferase involved in cell wall biosynthesis
MPVFNEQASVRKVVQEWIAEIENWTENFLFLAIDDGSTDDTRVILERLRAKHGNRLEILSRENRGHGQSCLQGYRIAAERNAAFVMQIDSDGQCDPQYFFKLWRIREHYDVIYGVRARRDDGIKRVVASRVLQLVVFAVTGAWCADGNVPYRLMNTRAIEPFLDRIPSDFFLANVGLAAVLRKQPGMRHGAVPIHFRERYGGEPSVPLSKFGGRASQLIRQLRGVLE